MKWLIASDIHGSAHYCRLLFEAMDKENADRLILLGDLLYHGPRNDLPKGYAPKEVIALLSARKEKILAVRGNCDTEVDQMVLPFPILADYAVLSAGERLIYLTHGHIYHETHLPPLTKGDILIHGHTHVPVVLDVDGITVLNPGSVSIPKENSPHGYMTFDGTEFLWKDLDGTVYKTFSLVS